MNINCATSLLCSDSPDSGEGSLKTKLGTMRQRKVISWIKEIPDILMLAFMMEFNIGVCKQSVT